MAPGKSGLHECTLQCSCLENPRDGEPGGLLSMGLHRVRHSVTLINYVPDSVISNTELSKAFTDSVKSFKWENAWPVDVSPATSSTGGSV